MPIATGPFPVARGTRMLDELASEMERFGPPVIVFNKSHSGSRLLVRALRALDVYMGAKLNGSEDSLPMLTLVEFIVDRHVPDFTKLFLEGDPDLPNVVRKAVQEHLGEAPPATRWGWKLCETVYILPVLARIFPRATFVHLIRDGRDIAFADHVSPKGSFWRKIYFHTDRIERWMGLPMSQRAYRANRHLFNVRHWVMSVSLGRHYGAMLGDRYVEVRYEDLVRDFLGTVERLAARLGVSPDRARLAEISGSIRPSRTQRWRREAAWKAREATAVAEPLLTELGYNERRRGGPMPRRSWLRRLLWT